jgi:integrase
VARTPKPWFREDRGEWYVTIRGERRRLGPDKAEAERRFHELMAERPKPQPAPAAPTGLTVAELFEKFLDWCHKHRAERTYRDHRERIQAFLNGSPGTGTLPAEALRPFHVIEWVDQHPSWGAAFRRNAIVAIQRPYNWAEELGYIAASPVKRIKKPPVGRRERIVTPAEWQVIRDHYPEGDPFRDLLEFAWDTGCRPHEARTIEPRHVHFDRMCVLFPPPEAKGKKRWRIIRLTQRAAAILRRRMGERTEGVVFLNADGGPWTAYAMNCRFCRLKKHTGVKHFAYALRHGFANRKLVAGHDHLTVAELMGHADGTMLAKVYQHLDQSDDYLRKALGEDA